MSNKNGPINVCNTRFAKCNSNKKATISNGNTNNNQQSNATRVSRNIQYSTYTKSIKLVFVNQTLNQYGRIAGGPGGYGSSPKNTF
jgi:hypothetical protein